MSSHKGQHSIESIKREIYAIMRELKDPRVQNGFISIVKIDMSKDKSRCRVYVSAMEGLEVAKQAVEGLQSACGYIKREIGNRLRLRYVPSITFQATDSIEYAASISETLNKLKERNENEIIK